MRISGDSLRSALIVTVLGFAAACQSNPLLPTPQRKIGESGVWPSQPPADCPFPKSTDISAIAFTGSGHMVSVVG